MIRILGLFGLTGGFLFISPSMRSTVMGAAGGFADFVQDHSPYSYFGGAVLVFAGITMTLLTGQRAR